MGGLTPLRRQLPAMRAYGTTLPSVFILSGRRGGLVSRRGSAMPNGVPFARAAGGAATRHRPQRAIYPSLLPAKWLRRSGRLRLENAGDTHAAKVLYTSLFLIVSPDVSANWKILKTMKM